MNNKKIVIIFLFIVISILNIVILDLIEVKMCKSFSLYRLFTMNSTVCKNLSKGVSLMESLLTTSIVAGCTSIFQDAIALYNPSNNRIRQLNK